MAILAMIFLGLLIVSFVIVAAATRVSTAETTVQSQIASIRRDHRGDNTQESDLTPVPKRRFSDCIGEHLKQYHFAENLQELILFAGSKSSVGFIVLLSLGLALAFATAVRFFIGSWPLVAVAVVIGAILPYGALRFQKSKRLKKFNLALPDAMELLARALRAGHSMSSAIEIIAEQSVEPLASEFGLCFQQQKFGIPFRDTLLQMGERTPSKDLHFLITAVLVQKETGGDLIDILDRTTRVIRDRIRIEGEVRTYTAQGRLTGWILGFLPIIMLVLINIMTPGYSHILFYDPVGQKLLYAGATLIAIGGLIIRKIVTIKV